MNDFECEEYLFSSNFDSGNLRKVELARSCSESEVPDYAVHFEFNLWTTPDCYGTPYENPNRTWFFFSIKGGKPYRNVKLNVKNLNRQAKLFSQGMQPVMRVGENGKWERIKDKPAYGTEGDSFFISFIHRSGDAPEIPYYYAFTYPFTYTENLNLLDKFDKKYSRDSQDIDFIINRIAYLDKQENECNSKKADQIKAIGTPKSINKDPSIIENSLDTLNLPSSPSDASGDSSPRSSNDLMFEKMTKRELQNEIYYHRELLIHSLEKRRVELLTITSYHGIQNELEERLSNLFPDSNTPRCRNFKDKKIVFMSSRVHPGETAASFVLNGFMNLILDRKSLIGQTLRQIYVFKIVPFLNPDGVYNGLYRTDTLGQNLNRMYICPQIERQPSIYAVKKIIKYYHLGYDKFDEENNRCYPLETIKPTSSLLAASETKETEKRDEISSTASLFDFVDKLRRDVTKNQNEGSNQRSSSKDTTSSEGEENNSPPSVENVGIINSQPQGKTFTDKLIPELKTVAQQSPLPKNLSGSSGFSKKTTDHLTRKTFTLKTVFGANHGGLNRSSNDSKLKDLQNSTSVQRPKYKKLISRKDMKSGNSSNLSLKTLKQRNLLCCQNIDISSEHLLSVDEGIDKPEKTNLFLYMDFHGHASKKGIFMYGNHFQCTPEAVECMLLPRLMGINCQHFHYDACNFSERNMYRREKRDGLSKEGSGRVAIYKMTGLIKCYTLESNYNTGKYVNPLPSRMKDINQKPLTIVPPKYSPSIYEEIGRAIGPSILDITNSNTISRIYNSEFRSVQALRIALRNEVERHGSQRSGVNGGKVLSSQHNVKRIKRSSLSTASTSNDVSKENKVLYNSNWELAVPSSSTQNPSGSVLHGLNQPSKVQRTTRCIKRNPLKAHPTNLYGKKDAIVNKKKPKTVLLLDSSSSNAKKEYNFQIPPKKVRVSPTQQHVLAKDSSPPSRKITEIPGSPDTARCFEPHVITDINVEGIETKTTTDTDSDTSSKQGKTGCPLPTSVSMTQFFPEGDVALLKKCTSESGLDVYATIADTMLTPTSSNSLASYKSSGAVDDAVPGCSSRLIVHGSNTKPILATFRKTKKADTFLLKSVSGGAGGGSNLASTLNSKMKSAFGGSENSKLVKKKRIIRHDSLIVKRKKIKGKITRH